MTEPEFTGVRLTDDQINPHIKPVFDMLRQQLVDAHVAKGDGPHRDGFDYDMDVNTYGLIVASLTRAVATDTWDMPPTAEMVVTKKQHDKGMAAAAFGLGSFLGSSFCCMGHLLSQVSWIAGAVIQYARTSKVALDAGDAKAAADGNLAAMRPCGRA